jgi:hypothetical protein
MWTFNAVLDLLVLVLFFGSTLSALAFFLIRAQWRKGATAREIKRLTRELGL